MCLKNAGQIVFLTPKRWIESVNAIGLINKAGRYGGGTLPTKILP